MVIEFDLIQNFVLAIIIVSLFMVLVMIIKHLLKKEMTPATESQPEPVSTNSPNPPLPYHEKNNEDQEDYKSVIKSAQKHAKTLLYHSSIAASDILIGAKKTNEHMEENLDKILQGIAAKDIHELKSTTSQFDKEYRQTLQDIQKQLQEITTTMMENSKNSYNEKLDEFTKDLLKNGLTTKTELDKKTSELIAKAESEIEEYKKSKLSKVDEEINHLIQTVYRDVLRISIPENVHQELIIKSLEDAKKDGMFKL